MLDLPEPRGDAPKGEEYIALPSTLMNAVGKIRAVPFDKDKDIVPEAVEKLDDYHMCDVCKQGDEECDPEECDKYDNSNMWAITVSNKETRIGKIAGRFRGYLCRCGDLHIQLLHELGGQLQTCGCVEGQLGERGSRGRKYREESSGSIGGGVVFCIRSSLLLCRFVLSYCSV